jgi:RNA polymerase sigma-70 factor (ECF subfamily)
MSSTEYLNQSGPFEARYLAFLETITQLRPSLHRYCARMTGSVMDGEDVVQEALFKAYRKLDKFDANRPLKPWLFRIAHNLCIDFLRKRGVRVEAESAAARSDRVEPTEPPVLGLGRALEHVVINLPPMERACVLLKEVLDYSLEEVAELVDSTVGGVKAALHRGRAKLAKAPTQPASARSANPELTRIMNLYVERFNRRDWDGVRELISADARLMVADAFAGRLANAPYFTNYERWPMPWKLAAGEVDGEPVVVILQPGADTWTPFSMVRLNVVDQRIDGIRDYVHCPWIISTAASVTVATPS